MLAEFVSSNKTDFIIVIHPSEPEVRKKQVLKTDRWIIKYIYTRLPETVTITGM